MRRLGVGARHESGVITGLLSWLEAAPPGVRTLEW